MNDRERTRQPRLSLRVAVAATACLLIAWSTARAPRAAAPDAAAAALDAFLSAATPDAERQAASVVQQRGVSFDAAYARLQTGRAYAADVPRGIVVDAWTAPDGTVFPYTLDVPQGYTAASRWPMRVQLHGGVGRPEAAPRGAGIGALAGDEQIYLLPTAWAGAEWWTTRQLVALRGVMRRVAERYNIDENRVVLSGSSDGGTGTYYMSMRDTTPYAAFLPLIGAVAVLQNTSMRVDGALYMQNMVNKPFFIVNGGRDPLYPTTLVEPYIQQMQKGGVEVVYRPQEDGVHNTAWFPQVKDDYEAFVRTHPRQPFPTRLSWQTDMSAGTTRAHWLVIDRLAPPRAEAAPLPDVNDQLGVTVPEFGIRANGTTVTAVSAGSNADALHLLPGDVITRLNQRPLPGGVDVTALLELLDVDSALTLDVRRGAETRTLTGTYHPTPAPSRRPIFVHSAPSGRVDLVRDGNTITATTRGVAAFTLLLSPAVINFAAPVTVVADGRTVFTGRVRPTLETLLTWYARDHDRTMLVGAELPITLTP